MSGEGSGVRAARTLLGCLVKGPLGCLAFFGGAAVVFVGFLPSACGRMTSGAIEDWFDTEHAGRLELRDPWFPSFYGPQRLGFVLRDPSGVAVVRGQVTAPSLGGLFEDGAEGWGPLDVVVETIELVRHRDGSLNLAQALEHTGRVADRSDKRFDLGEESNLAIELVVHRMRWSAPGSGNPDVLLHGLHGQGELATRGGVTALVLEGTGELEEPAAGRVGLWLELPDVERLLEPGERPPRLLRATLEDVRTTALDSFAGTDGFFVRAFGERAARVAMRAERDHMQNERLWLEVDADGVQASLAGAPSPDGRHVEAGEEGELRVRFGAGSWWARDAVPRLLPMLIAVHPLEAGGRFALGAVEFSVPLDARAADLGGAFRLHLGDVAYEPAPALVDVLRAHGHPPDGWRASGAEVQVAVRAGRVDFEAFELPGVPGVRFAGACGLTTGACALRVELGEAAADVTFARAGD